MGIQIRGVYWAYHREQLSVHIWWWAHGLCIASAAWRWQEQVRYDQDQGRPGQGHRLQGCQGRVTARCGCCPASCRCWHRWHEHPALQQRNLQLLVHWTDRPCRRRRGLLKGLLEGQEQLGKDLG